MSNAKKSAQQLDAPRSEREKREIEEQEFDRERKEQSGFDETRDNPEQVPTNRKSLFDRFESERNVDPIPVEDLTIEQEDEKHKKRTKSSSSTERAYKRGMK